jgi:hypothetical protein
MVIKKIFNLINITKKKSLKNKTSVINSIGAESTLIGRKKVESLKKIGKNKRR